jgi:hypothetical protein
LRWWKITRVCFDMAQINPGRLKLELFCAGARIDKSCTLEADTRPVKRTRGGLGSGLDVILPGKTWVNIPVAEPFAQKSPYILVKEDGQYQLCREIESGKNNRVCKVFLPPRPDWYAQKTGSGKLMGDIGVMQGTYFAVYPSDLCGFWKDESRRNCRFCSIGLCHGKTESEEKTVADVIESVKAAIRHEHITFVHFNTGFYEDDRALDVIGPYVKAVKRETRLLVGVQCPPAIDLSKYDQLKKAGTDHVSFCYEIFSPEHFREICPGKSAYFGERARELKSDRLLQEVRRKAETFEVEPDDGQLIFYRALAYCSTLWRKGQVSGEIVAGLEPTESSIKAVEFNASFGAVSTVCVFRPCVGTDLEKQNPPEPNSIAPVLARMYEVCLERAIPYGIAPNIRTAMVHLPEEGRYLSLKNYGLFRKFMSKFRQGAMKVAFRTMFALSR